MGVGSADGPLTREGLRVCSRLCSTCIFRPGNLMQLNAGRLRDMIDGSLAADSAIPCHKTIWERDGAPAVCRGFYDRYRADTVMLRLGELYGVVEIDPDG
jgi:hypothetical protein